jgi:hypothetical protein
MYTKYKKPNRKRLQNIYSTSIQFSAFVLFALNFNSINLLWHNSYIHDKINALRLIYCPILLNVNIKNFI